MILTLRCGLSATLALGLLGGESRPPAWSSPTCCPVLELRQYTLRPGQREVFIELFDRELVETQEAEGMKILGQFRNLDDPSQFVWLRGFADMADRARALRAFYAGAAWKAHSRAANSTMVDVSNVRLLRPVRPASGFALDGLRRPGRDATGVPSRLVTATIYSLDAPADGDFLEAVEREVGPALEDAGASLLAWFATESSANTFPALPVREGEHVFVLFAAFRDLAAYERHRAELGRTPRSTRGTEPALSTRLKRPPETLRLSPTARSLVGP